MFHTFSLLFLWVSPILPANREVQGLKDIGQNPSSSMCSTGNTFRIKDTLNLNFWHDIRFPPPPQARTPMILNRVCCHPSDQALLKPISYKFLIPFPWTWVRLQEGSIHLLAECLLHHVKKSACSPQIQPIPG